MIFFMMIMSMDCIPPYFKTFTKEEVSERLLTSNFLKPEADKNYFIWFVKNNYNPEKYFRNPNEILYSKLDDAILENHIKSFFKKSSSNSNSRKKHRCNNKTRKDLITVMIVTTATATTLASSLPTRLRLTISIASLAH